MIEPVFTGVGVALVTLFVAQRFGTSEVVRMG